MGDEIVGGEGGGTVEGDEDGCGRRAGLCIRDEEKRGKSVKKK